VNVKELQYLDDTNGVLVKKIKPNFKTLGPRYGKMMKQIATAIDGFSAEDIAHIENKNEIQIQVDGQAVDILLSDVEIISEDIPGWLVANEGALTVALDVTITPVLKNEGIARELINRIQNLRKDIGLEVTDKIEIFVEKHNEISGAVSNNYEYICSETLATDLHYVDSLSDIDQISVDLTDMIQTNILIKKC
jgi:isoleucyl-tRNA synthetase